jgi:hypothetical protein
MPPKGSKGVKKSVTKEESSRRVKSKQSPKRASNVARAGEIGVWEEFSADGKFCEEQVGKLCEALEIDPAGDPVVLVLAFLCGAKEMGTFTQAEVQQGLRELGVETTAELRAAVPEMRQMLAEEKFAKRIYSFAFDFSLEENMRGLHMEVAVELWKILLKDRFGLLEPFLAYIEGTSMKAISKDLWSMVFDFATSFKVDLSDYDLDGGAWPVVLDEFVQHHREQQAKDGSATDVVA